MQTLRAWEIDIFNGYKVSLYCDDLGLTTIVVMQNLVDLLALKVLIIETLLDVANQGFDIHFSVSITTQHFMGLQHVNYTHFDKTSIEHLELLKMQPQICSSQMFKISKIFGK